MNQRYQPPGAKALVPAADDYKLEELILLYRQVSELSADIAAAIERKCEPVQELNRLNYLLEAEFEKVWAMLHHSADVLNQITQVHPDEAKDISTNPNTGSSALLPPESEDQIISRPSEPSEILEIKSETQNVKIAFYENVLGKISILMLEDHPVQSDVGSPSHYLEEI